MKQKNSNNNIVKWIILIVGSIEIGTFIDCVLENIKMNIWFARTAGALGTLIATLLLYNLLIKNKHTNSNL